MFSRCAQGEESPEMRKRPARHAVPAQPGGVPSVAAATRAEAQAILAGQRVFSSRECKLAKSTQYWWEDLTSLSCTRLQCCAFCGLCAFPQVKLPAHDGQPASVSKGSHMQGAVKPQGKQAQGRSAEQLGTPFRAVSPVCAGPTPPYARQCSVLRNACVTPGGDWRVCATCKANPKKRAALQTTVTPSLVADLLGVDPVEAQVCGPSPPAARPRWKP